MAITITCTNGNGRNRISGSRIRWTCTVCEEIVAEHLSPCHGPAGYYENKHPGGEYANEYRERVYTAVLHEQDCKRS